MPHDGGGGGPFETFHNRRGAAPMNAARRRSHADHVELDSLEPRQLLATGFNPDGPTIATPAEAPSSIVTADFDGDAKPDLVMAVGRDILFQKGGGGGKFG